MAWRSAMEQFYLHLVNYYKTHSDQLTQAQWRRIESLTLYIVHLCSVDNQFTTLDQQNTQYCSLDILYYIITLNIPTWFDPQGLIISESNESNTIQKQTSNLCIQQKEVKELNSQNVGTYL
jgi:hypothetical protein